MGLFSSLPDRPRPGAINGTAGAVEPTSPNATPIRVFLVEDSAAVRERLIDYLADPGAVEVVGYADTERAAAAWLVETRVDVVIVDLNLREGSGIGVIEAVRARFPTAPPVLVVLTNYAFPEFEQECRRRGADHFYDKSTQFGAVKRLLVELRQDRG